MANEKQRELRAAALMNKMSRMLKKILKLDEIFDVSDQDEITAVIPTVEESSDSETDHCDLNVENFPESEELSDSEVQIENDAASVSVTYKAKTGRKYVSFAPRPRRRQLQNIVKASICF